MLLAETGPAESMTVNSGRVLTALTSTSAWLVPLLVKTTFCVGAGEAPTCTLPKFTDDGAAATSMSTPTPVSCTCTEDGLPSSLRSSVALSGPACEGVNCTTAVVVPPTATVCLSWVGSLKLLVLSPTIVWLRMESSPAPVFLSGSRS